MDQVAQGAIKRVIIEAVVIRADGTVEPLGTVSDSSWKWYSPLGQYRKLKASRRTEALNRLHGMET
jgi:hypothetical protein